MRTAPVRRSLNGSTGPRGDVRPSRTSACRIGGRWLTWLVVAAGLVAPAGLSAQTAKDQGGGDAATKPVGQTSATPLARYVLKDHLQFYCEFSGLDAHAATWNKTAAYRMLTETPLGVMLEEVAAQLLDKGLSYVPDPKITGAEIITLVKYLARHGFVMAVNLKPAEKAEEVFIYNGVMVIKGGSAKEIRPLTSRLLGLMMAGSKPRIERKEGRQLVVVPHQPAPGAAPGPKTGEWTWWDENGDLVLSSPHKTAPDDIIAALDGKKPSAADHPIVQELSKGEGSFDPVGLAFVNFAEGIQTQSKTGIGTAFENVTKLGIQRFDYRWGFDDDALMSVARLVAPRPRKPFLAVFDQPGFDGKSLIPLPDGVGAFLEVSISPNQLLDTISELGPPGVVKGKIEDFAEVVEKSGSIDLRKDVLAHLGPRMILYVAPGRSAAAGNESFETSWLQEFNPQKALASLRSIPKLTLVAEIDDPVQFGKALDGVVLAVNNMLKGEALEAAEEKKEEEGQEPGAGANTGRASGARKGATSKKGSRRRSTDTPAPKFETMLVTGDAKAYLLRTPSDSPIRFGPSGFRPVIRLEGKYLAISIAADSAEMALKAVKSKNWKSSDDVQRASEHLPSKMVLLAVGDPREVLPQLLASLPATLQTIINVVIAQGRARPGNNPMGGGMNQPGSRAGMAGPGGRPGMAGGGRTGGRGMRGGPGGSGGPGAPPPGDNTNAGSPTEGMITLKVDSDKLPNAEAIRSRLFLTTFAISVTDQDIRVTSRQAFFSPISLGVGVALLLPAVQASREAARRAQEAAAAQAPAAAQGAPGSGPGAGGPPGSRPGAGGPGGAPGRFGGRKGRPGG
jgi:hypothetical protein